MRDVIGIKVVLYVFDIDLFRDLLDTTDSL